MNTVSSFNEDNFLASPDVVAGLLASMGDSRADRRGRAIRELPSWLSQLLASADQVAKERCPSPVPSSQPHCAPVLPVVPVAKPVQASRGRHSAFGPAIRAKALSARRGRCRCGGCQQGLENAHWNRIFDEKFADPAYYGHLRIRRSSTLA